MSFPNVCLFFAPIWKILINNYVCTVQVTIWSKERVRGQRFWYLKHCWFQIVIKVIGDKEYQWWSTYISVFVAGWIFFYWCSRRGSKLSSIFCRCFKSDFKRVPQYCFKGVFLIISNFLTDLLEYAYVLLSIDSLL